MEEPIYCDGIRVGCFIDPCPACHMTDLRKEGSKEVCPACNYIQPCCQP